MLKQTSGNHDATTGVVDGLSGTLCVPNEIGDVEKSNGAASIFQDISSIALDIDIDSDNQLAGLKTLPALRRPDFLYGKMNTTTASQVKKAVIASRTCRDMCAEWAEHAMASDRTSNINDKILKWCQNEFFRADPMRSKVQQAVIEGDAGNGAKVGPQIDPAGSESIKKPSFGNMFRTVFCCGYRPVAEAKKGQGSQVKEVDIFIQRLNGTIFSVNVNADKPQVDENESLGSDLILTEKVGMLKKKIYRKKGIPPDTQLLVFENKNLEDEKALHECRISAKSTIHLIQLRSVLGIEDSVTVTATEERGIEFKKKTFAGLYRWYRDGQQRPDVYMGQFLNGRFQGVGEVVYQDGGYYRGEWADDQQHGFGVQRWESGAVYCGNWDRNTENGWGAYFAPSNSPSQHNPHSAQMLFIGHFRNGCPTDGMVIECTDFRELTTESFTQCDAAAKDILAQQFRVYDTCYDGVTAFWQLPIPKRKRGFFDLKLKLCEYEAHRVDRPLAHKSTLQEIWYKWIPNPKKEKKEKASKTLGDDEDQAAETDTLVLPTTSPKQTMYEMFHFHGTCIRDKGGHFPCPTEGVLSFDSKTRGSQNNMKNELLVECTATFNPCSNDNPTLQHLEGKAKYAIPASDSLAKDGKLTLKNGKDIKSLLCDFLNINLLESTDQERLAGLITHIEFEGELHRINFPLHGMMLIGGEIMKVDFDGETSIQRFVSHKSSGKVDGSKDNKTSSATNGEVAEKSDDDQDDNDDYETENYDDSSWGEMERYCINFEKWMLQKQESKLIVKLHVPTTEPPVRQDQISVLREPSDAMKEAVKMQAYDVWQPAGVLTRRSQGFPLESCVMETVHSGAGFVYEGWSTKVFCPKRGIFKLLIENDPNSKHKSIATDEDRNSLSKGTFDFDVDLEECILFPGSEDWFRYALTRIKMVYIQKMRIEQTKLNEELIQLKCVDFANAKNTLFIKKKELTSALNLDRRIKQDDLPNMDLVENSYQHQILNILSLFPEGCVEKSSKQPKLSKEIVESKKRAVDQAKKKLSQFSFSVMEKEFEAAKKNELCTGVAVVENTSHYLRAKQNMKRLQHLLKKSVDNIAKEMEATNAEVEKLSKISEKLNAGVKPGLSGQPETSAQAKAKKARLAVDLARLDPSISKVRMSIVRRTIHLLQGIENFEKAANVHQELILAKAGARLNSDAALRRQKLFIRALAQGCLTDLDLDTDDSDLLSVLKERTKDDLLKQINSASVDSSRKAELLQLQEELQKLEEKQCEEEIRATDLNAEIQIAIARLGAEEAESNLWSEWAHSAMMEENDRPAQGPSTGIGLKLAALDEANKRLRNALGEAKKHADLQFRKSAPASEVHPKADLCKTAWVPETAVSPDNLAKAVSKLVVQAQRVIHLSGQYLQGPALRLVSPPLNDSARMCKVITDAKRELQSLAQLHKGAVTSFPASL